MFDFKKDPNKYINKYSKGDKNITIKEDKIVHLEDMNQS